MSYRSFLLFLDLDGADGVGGVVLAAGIVATLLNLILPPELADDNEDDARMGRDDSSEEVEKVEKSMRKDASRDLFYIGISKYAPKSKKPSKANWATEDDNEHGRKRQRTKYE